MSVYGKGVNDATYETQVFTYENGKNVRVWYCPLWNRWSGMLRRCFSLEMKSKRESYEDVTCCEEWLLFSNFKRWMEQQDREGKELDKDIITTGNSVYSPDTCAFVHPLTNVFILDRANDRGNLPLGVTHASNGDKYVSRCGNPFTKKREYLGVFTTPEEAHEAWRKRKHELAQLVAETESDPRVVEALKKRYSVEEWYGNKT